MTEKVRSEQIVDLVELAGIEAVVHRRTTSPASRIAIVMTS
jgi:hypothetical protein